MARGEEGSRVGRRNVGMRASLQEIEDLGHVLLVPLFRLGDITTPLARIPDLHAMVQAHQNDFLVLIQRNNFSEPTRNQDASGFVDL